MKRNIYTYVIILCEVMKIVTPSIAGVTYMDHFDFEERYRDVNECNPFYWHPLHLPPECVQMFENLIRSRLEMFTPYRVVKETSSAIYDQAHMMMYHNNYIYSPIYKAVYKPELQYLPNETRTPSQYEMLYELLKRDVRDLPSAPFLGVSPYLGVIAMYKQPVSYKSAAMIKKLARVYDNSDLFAGLQPDSKNGNNDEKQKTKIKTHKKLSHGNLVVDKIVEDNNALALLKIKRLK